MKPNPLFIVSALLTVGAACITLAAPEPAQQIPQAKLRPTHEVLKQRQQEAAAQASKGAKGDGVQTVKPGEIKYESRKKLGNLLDRSSILCAGGYWTLVPKEAVIHVPASYKSRVDGARTGKLIPWSEFYAKNRGWLQTHSVSIPQARGEQAMDPKKVDVYRSSGRVVVAVCHNGPISVKPVKIPDAVAEAPAAK